MLRIAARKASHIFTVSEYSKRRLVEELHISEEKVTVVYNGVGAQFSPGDRAQAREGVALGYSVSLPYILYVGSLKPHKNITTLLRSYASLWAGRMPEADLVIVGTGDPGKAELESLANALGVHPVFITDARDDQLVELYRAAEVLVLPSFEEGFGLSIVEAMACGTPVICANAASMPEIAGEAAILFDPHDVQDLIRALTSLLSSSDLRRSLRERGLIRAKQFTWLETASRHIPVYEKFRP
jgi:glycosyltransferase involved in cell wall biosynthesis